MDRAKEGGVAVVILNWNGLKFLRQFLPGVCRSTAGLAEVVVADNGSEDGSLDYIHAECPGVKTVAFTQNWGFAEGYNRALKWVRETLSSDIYILLNSDVEVTEGWLAPLVARLRSSEQVWAVMPKIRSWHRRDFFEYAGACGGYLDMLGYPYCRGRMLATVEQDCGQYDDARQVHWASGACLVVRAEAYWQAGGLEGRFFAHMEEIDLCWRMRSLGGQVWVEPSATVYHVGGGALPNDSPRKLYLNYRNSLWMLRRNWSRGRGILLLPLRLCLDGLSAMMYLLQGRTDAVRAVLRAHVEFWRTLGEWRSSASFSAPLGHRLLVWDYFVLGRKTFLTTEKST